MIFLCAIVDQLASQDTPSGQIKINGEIVHALIEDGDTLIIADLDSITVTAPALLKNPADHNRYRRYRRYASKVYPYAVESIRVFREMEAETRGLKKRKRRKYTRKKQRELKEEFTDPLKNLTRTQGKILIKMIEKELDTSMHTLLKNVRGGFSAGKWQFVGKLNGYDLKEGYIYGQDPILDAVLNDFDISYEVN